MKKFLSAVCLFFSLNCNVFASRIDDVIKIGIVGPVKDQIFENNGQKHVVPTHMFINRFQTALIDAKNRVDKKQKFVLIPILKYPEMMDYYIDNLDGILISGSSIDLNPATYGQEPHPKTDSSPLEFSNFDIDLIKKASNKKIPILGICYGMQVLSVAFGGSLNQNIEGHMRTVHDIEINKNSLLYELNNKQTTNNVNSFHHQAVAKIPDGWTISAKANDGIIEGIENLKNGLYLFGVEWHPEASQENTINKAIFDSFYKTTLKYKKSGLQNH